MQLTDILVSHTIKLENLRSDVLPVLSSSGHSTFTFLFSQSGSVLREFQLFIEVIFYGFFWFFLQNVVHDFFLALI